MRQPCGHITVRGTALSLFDFRFLLLPSKELLLPADKHFGGHSMTVLHRLLSATQHLATCAFVTSDSLGECGIIIGISEFFQFAVKVHHSHTLVLQCGKALKATSQVMAAHFT